MSDHPYAKLEGLLQYWFADVARLESALTHKSYLNENPKWGRPDNERLEFLGDAVLDLVVGHLLMESAPTRSEGELSKTRAAIVSEQGLYEVALELGIGEWLFLGRGEESSGGRRKPSLLADTCEALIAAVYLDGGFDAAFKVVKALFGVRMAAAELAIGAQDYKTRLQEKATQKKLAVRYHVVGQSGPEHDKTFEVAAFLGTTPESEKEYARGFGKTKKEAEQRAAELVLPMLDLP
jgi:ribonuclease-3